MQNTTEDIRRLETEFKGCCDLFAAIGDEVRQQLIFILLEGPCTGTRVVDAAKKMNLSRPAVSQHMQILKNSGLVKARKEGTCIYYYLEPEPERVLQLCSLSEDIRRLTLNAPDRAGED